MWSFLFEPTKSERECPVSVRTGGLSLGLEALTLFFWRCRMLTVLFMLQIILLCSISAFMTIAAMLFRRLDRQEEVRL